MLEGLETDAETPCFLYTGGGFKMFPSLVSYNVLGIDSVIQVLEVSC